jgi:hypothetical protein
VKRATLTTAEAAWLLGIDPRSFTRWARERGVEPLRRMRIGRSTVTVWSLAALKQATREQAQLDTAKTAC